MIRFIVLAIAFMLSTAGLSMAQCGSYSRCYPQYEPVSVYSYDKIQLVLVNPVFGFAQEVQIRSKQVFVPIVIPHESITQREIAVTDTVISQVKRNISVYRK